MFRLVDSLAAQPYVVAQRSLALSTVLPALLALATVLSSVNVLTTIFIGRRDLACMDCLDDINTLFLLAAGT